MNLSKSKSILDYYRRNPSKLNDANIYIIICQSGLDTDEEDKRDVIKRNEYSQGFHIYINWDDLPVNAYLIDIFFDEVTGYFEFGGIIKTPKVKDIRSFTKIDQTVENLYLCHKVSDINGLIITNPDERLLHKRITQLLNCNLGVKSFNKDVVEGNIIKLNDAMPILFP